MKNALPKLIDLYTKAYNICQERGLVNAFTRRIDDQCTDIPKAIELLAEFTIGYMTDGDSYNVFKNIAIIDPDTYGPKTPRLGLCSNVLLNTDGIYELALFLTWPKTTFNLGYPVPNTEGIKAFAYGSGFYGAPDGTLDNHGIYLHYSARGDLWDSTTQYGRDRYDLLEYIVSVSRDICGTTC